MATAHSWWIQCSLDPMIRCWSRVLSPMGRTGSRYSVIGFSTPLKRIRWVASSGYLTWNSFPQNFEDSGADIACWDERRPLIESLARSPNHSVNPPVSMRIRATSNRIGFGIIDLGDIVHGLLTQNSANFQFRDICPPSLAPHLSLPRCLAAIVTLSLTTSLLFD